MIPYLNHLKMLQTFPNKASHCHRGLKFWLRRFFQKTFVIFTWVKLPVNFWGALGDVRSIHNLGNHLYYVGKAGQILPVNHMTSSPSCRLPKKARSFECHPFPESTAQRLIRKLKEEPSRANQHKDMHETISSVSFRGATKRLYNWLCPSVGQLVGW